MKTKEHLAHFNIAGFTYYNGAQCFKKLKIGKKVKLVLENDNKFDARAVAIYYKKHKLGFVPRNNNRIIYKLLTVGLSSSLKARIQTVAANEHLENQIQIVVHLVANNIVMIED